MGHRSAAPQIIKQTAVSLTKLGGCNLVGKMHVASTTGLRETLEKRFWTLEIIEGNFTCPTGSYGHQDLRHPIGMGGTSGDIDNGKAGFAFEVLAEKTTFLALENLHKKSDRVFPSAGNASQRFRSAESYR